jgi:hypothetical protein
LIAGIRNDAIEARYYFEVYRTYMLQENREKYSEILLVYGNFFACDLRAHFAAMMVTLGRIFDNNTKCIGIPLLLQATPQLKQVASEKFERIQQLWNSKKIFLLRHQVIAHRSSSATVQQIFKIVETTLNELGEATRPICWDCRSGAPDYHTERQTSDWSPASCFGATLATRPPVNPNRHAPVR